MKLINIQADILKKDLALKNKNKRIWYAVDEEKEIIFCTLDSIVGYFIPLADFKIDVSKLNEGGESNIHSFYPDTKTIKPATRENISKVINNNGADITVTKIGNKWVNVKLLAYFDKGATFGTNPDSTTSIVYIYENDTLVGLVCPMRMPNEN